MDKILHLSQEYNLSLDNLLVTDLYNNAVFVQPLFEGREEVYSRWSKVVQTNIALAKHIYIDSIDIPTRGAKRHTAIMILNDVDFIEKSIKRVDYCLSQRYGRDDRRFNLCFTDLSYHWVIHIDEVTDREILTFAFKLGAKVSFQDPPRVTDNPDRILPGTELEYNDGITHFVYGVEQGE